MLKTQPEYDSSSVDLVACSNTMGNLFRFKTTKVEPASGLNLIATVDTNTPVENIDDDVNATELVIKDDGARISRMDLLEIKTRS